VAHRSPPRARDGGQATLGHRVRAMEAPDLRCHPHVVPNTSKQIASAQRYQKTPPAQQRLRHGRSPELPETWKQQQFIPAARTTHVLAAWEWDAEGQAAMAQSRHRQSVRMFCNFIQFHDSTHHKARASRRISGIVKLLVSVHKPIPCSITLLP
jgi:hypothetical protein